MAQDEQRRAFKSGLAAVNFVPSTFRAVDPVKTYFDNSQPLAKPQWTHCPTDPHRGPSHQLSEMPRECGKAAREGSPLVNEPGLATIAARRCREMATSSCLGRDHGPSSSPGVILPGIMGPYVGSQPSDIGHDRIHRQPTGTAFRMVRLHGKVATSERIANPFYGDPDLIPPDHASVSLGWWISCVMVHCGLCSSVNAAGSGDAQIAWMLSNRMTGFPLAIACAVGMKTWVLGIVSLVSSSHVRNPSYRVDDKTTPPGFSPNLSRPTANLFAY